MGEGGGEGGGKVLFIIYLFSWEVVRWGMLFSCSVLM